jgi:hypothetical protein
VLARLNQIDGVQDTAASLGIEGGSLVRVSLRPGANPAKVAEQVQRVLRQEVRERAVEAVHGQATPAALRHNEWLDTTQLAHVAAMETGPLQRRTPTLLALLFAVMGVALCLLGGRYLRQRRAARLTPLAAKNVRP